MLKMVAHTFNVLRSAINKHKIMYLNIFLNLKPIGKQL